MDELARIGAELRLLRDERAVFDTLYRASNSFYTIDLEGWLDCFVADGRFRMYRGRGEAPAHDLAGHDELRAWFVAHAERVPLGKANQIVSQPRAVIDGDRARATSFFAVIHNIDGAPTLFATGRFTDELLRCRDGVWRFTERRGDSEMRRPG